MNQQQIDLIVDTLMTQTPAGRRYMLQRIKANDYELWDSVKWSFMIRTGRIDPPELAPQPKKTIEPKDYPRIIDLGD